MGKVVTVMNMKGGVGKTTVCMHIGGLLPQRSFAWGKKNVLLIDYDPQFNLSQALLASRRYFQIEKQYKTCLAILQDKDADLQSICNPVSRICQAASSR
jgi:chromosome partitioning protein